MKKFEGCLSYQILKTLAALGIRIDDFEAAQEAVDAVIDEYEMKAGGE